MVGPVASQFSPSASVSSCRPKFSGVHIEVSRLMAGVRRAEFTISSDLANGITYGQQNSASSLADVLTDWVQRGNGLFFQTSAQEQEAFSRLTEQSPMGSLRSDVIRGINETYDRGEVPERRPGLVPLGRGIVGLRPARAFVYEVFDDSRQAATLLFREQLSAWDSLMEHARIFSISSVRRDLAEVEKRISSPFLQKYVQSLPLDEQQGMMKKLQAKRMNLALAAYREVLPPSAFPAIGA